MSMLDDLAATKRPRPGPQCVFQRAAIDHGDDFLADTLEMLMAPKYTSTQKAQVLKQHGYGVVDRQVIERHARHRLWSMSGCRGCSEWVQERPERFD